MKALIHHLFDAGTLWGATFYAALLLAIALLSARLIGRWSKRLVVHPRLLIDPTAAVFIAELLKVACFLAAAIVYAHIVPGLSRVGTALLASASIFSLILGLAAQNTLGHLIAGVALLLYRPFRIGDVLTFNAPTGKEIGTVQRIALGYTTLAIDDGRLVIIPNSVMISSVVIRIPPPESMPEDSATAADSDPPEPA